MSVRPLPLFPSHNFNRAASRSIAKSAHLAHRLRTIRVWLGSLGLSGDPSHHRPAGESLMHV